MTFGELFNKFAKAIGLIAPMALAFIPGGQIPAAAAAVIRALPALMAKADEVIQGIGKGAIKKDLVMTTAQLVVESVAALSTGGQKETWESLKPSVSTMIDTACAVANTFAPGAIDEQKQPTFA
jgi:hypothetical protein